VDNSRNFDALVARRAAREPLSRILGQREFWSLVFRVTADTLDPRPESETLVELVLDAIGAEGRSRPLSILDLGTGSGCLLLALLHELPMATGVGTDLSPAAVQVARENAVVLGLADRASFVASDWAKPINRKFDVILSNPPYIRSCGIDRLEPEVAICDPHRALDGGPDGLRCYRELAAILPILLAPGGVVVLEVGAEMDISVCRIMSEHNLKFIEHRKDLSLLVRCLAFRTDENRAVP